MNDSNSYEFAIRQHYKVLPTDPKFLALTQEQVVREFWMIYYHNVRNSPSEGADNEVVYEASESFETELDEYMRSQGLTNIDGQWVEVDPDDVRGLT